MGGAEAVQKAAALLQPRIKGLLGLTIDRAVGLCMPCAPCPFLDACFAPAPMCGSVLASLNPPFTHGLCLTPGLRHSFSLGQFCHAPIPERPRPCSDGAQPCIAAGVDGITWYTASSTGGAGADPIWSHDCAAKPAAGPAPSHHLLIPLKEPDLVLRLFLASRAIDAETDGRDLISSAVKAKVALRMHQLLEGEVLEGWLPLRSADAAAMDPFDVEAATHAPRSAIWHKCASCKTALLFRLALRRTFRSCAQLACARSWLCSYVACLLSNGAERVHDQGTNTPMRIQSRARAHAGNTRGRSESGRISTASNVACTPPSVTLPRPRRTRTPGGLPRQTTRTNSQWTRLQTLWTVSGVHRTRQQVC